MRASCLCWDSLLLTKLAVVQRISTGLLCGEKQQADRLKAFLASIPQFHDLVSSAIVCDPAIKPPTDTFPEARGKQPFSLVTGQSPPSQLNFYLVRTPLFPVVPSHPTHMSVSPPLFFPFSLWFRAPRRVPNVADTDLPRQRPHMDGRFSHSPMCAARETTAWKLLKRGARIDRSLTQKLTRLNLGCIKQARLRHFLFLFIFLKFMPERVHAPVFDSAQKQFT